MTNSSGRLELYISLDDLGISYFYKRLDEASSTKMFCTQLNLIVYVQVFWMGSDYCKHNFIMLGPRICT